MKVFISNLITMLRIKQDFFVRAISSISVQSDIIFPSVFMSYSAYNSQVSEVSTIINILTFCIMSGTRWIAVENVVFFSKRSIVIKLPVKL